MSGKYKTGSGGYTWSVFADALAAVEERIARAAARAGRARDSIQLIAVTKTFPPEVIEAAYAAGLRHFGENYVQEFEAKRPLLGPMAGAHYHLIGHLQSNKTRRAAELFQTIHTIDDIKLVRRLDETRARLDVLVEVKLSDEESKHGAPPEQLPDILERILQSSHLRLVGLMTIPPWSDDPEASRPYFARLRELAERHRPANQPALGLSMGMSNDFEVAIEEGATHIRIGTALFGRRAMKR